MLAHAARGLLALALAAPGAAYPIGLQQLLQLPLEALLRLEYSAGPASMRPGTAPGLPRPGREAGP